MAVAQYDLEIPAGGVVDFVVTVVGGPDSLAGYDGRMRIRGLRDDSATLAVIPSDSIEVFPDTRQVRVRIPSSETATYGWTRGVYDLVIVGPEDTWVRVEGRATSSRIISRED